MAKPITNMTPRFLAFIPFIIKHEVVFQRGHFGDYAYVVTENDKNDPGSTTRFGIDYGEHQHSPWNMAKQDINKLTLPEAQAIYFRHWNLDGCEGMPPKIGEAYFNCCTMSGIGQAKKIISRQKSVEGFLKDELNVFDMIVARRPAANEYLRGWKARIYDEAKFLGVDILT
jgi:hypothetical protein